MMRGGIVVLGCLAALLLHGGMARGDDKPRPTAGAPVLFNADEVQYDQELGVTLAKGHVELDQGDQILLADTVAYNQRTDTVTAQGHVALLQPSGDVAFADFVELRDDMRDGFIKDIRLLLSDNSRLAGNTARRVAGIRTTIRRAVYSPCELCAQDPSRPPVWQIKAEEVVHDKELQIIEYHDAVMEIDGVPVLYTPYFSHPDPSVKRASGFLPPTIGAGNSLGFHTTVPYFWAIAPDQDFTFRPLLTSSAGQVLAGEYRQRFGNGVIDNSASIEYGGGVQSEAVGSLTTRSGPVRGDFFGKGEFDLNDNWRARYDIERETDPTYALRYGFTTPTDYLSSNANAEYFGHNSYGVINGYAFQSLNPVYGNSFEPLALPEASYIWTSDPDAIGGRWRVGGSALNLEHLTGAEVRRVSSTTGWSLPFNGLGGDRFTFAVNLRTDAYSADHVALTPNSVSATNSLSQTIQLPSNVGTTGTVAGRVFPQASLTWRYPWARVTPASAALVEPIVAVIAGPNGENPARIPNEDSQGFEFDETSLFVPNRLPGYDRVDSGQRVDYGVHGEWRSPTYGAWDTLVGQSYRLEQNSIFLPGSGLNDRLSDVVGRVSLTPDPFFDLTYRFRFDKGDLAARRQEIGGSFGPGSLRVGASFISIAPVPGAAPTGDQVAANITAQVTRYWSVALNDTRSFGTGGATINSGVSVTYRDDCIAVVSSLVQSGIRVGDVRPGVSLLVTFVFKNLGEIGDKLLAEGGT